MKTIILSIFFSVCLVIGLQAQNKFSDVILSYAKKSADAQLALNIDEYLNYMHPNIIEMGGGKDLAKQAVQQQLNTYKSMNVDVVSITHGDPGPLVQAGSELHCIVPATTKLAQGDAEFDSVNNWLAISSDDGQSWAFVDMSYYDANSLKIYLPDYNSALVYPQN